MKIEFSQRLRFSDWPNSDLPPVAAGVYAIWDQTTLVYCGMSGREIDKAIASSKSKYGIVTRLASHASGRLSGDKFCVYVANRFVIPSLTKEQLPLFASAEINLDQLTKTYIHDRFEYQFAIVPTSAEAYELEKHCRNGNYFGVKPTLNPSL